MGTRLMIIELEIQQSEELHIETRTTGLRDTYAIERGPESICN